MKRLLLLLTLTTVSIPAWAQAPPTAPAPGTITNVEVDPIRCWWRTSSGAVRVGENFDLALTCAVLESDAVTVVPDESHLGAAVVAMAPFEVVNGTPVNNLHSGLRRFFQYQYVLRIINPDAIGKDVPLPVTVIHYKVNSRVAANTSVQGRDLTYVLPNLSVRVASMVPTDATDIRDSSGESFSIVESLNLRAGALEIVAITAVVLGSLMTLFVLVRLGRSATRRTPADQQVMGPRTLVGAASRELAEVQREREGAGWTDALAGRSLAATRIIAACALGRSVSQPLAEAGAAAGQGRVVTGSSMLARGKPRALSSPVTGGDVARYAATRGSNGDQQSFDELRAALVAFSVTQYAKEPVLDQSALDTALAGAVAAAGRVRAEHSWLKTAIRSFMSHRTAVPSRA